MSDEQPKNRRKDQRRKKDRRTSKLEALFRYAVEKGTFIDVRRSDRRTNDDRRKLPFDIDIYLN